MSKWLHADVLDNGPAYIKANCNSVVAVLSYAAGDSYATVTTAGNIVGQTAMATGDFTLGSSGSNRTLTTAAGKQDASADNTLDPTHIAFVDTVNSKVLWVTDETSVQTVTAGNPLTFPSLVLTAAQPT